jgi:hypothetical protein
MHDLSTVQSFQMHANWFSAGCQCHPDWIQLEKDSYLTMHKLSHIYDTTFSGGCLFNIRSWELRKTFSGSWCWTPAPLMSAWFFFWGCTTWTGYFKCREVKTGFYRNRSMQTGSSGTLIGWKSGQTTFVPLWDRMEGAWLRTLVRRFYACNKSLLQRVLNYTLTYLVSTWLNPIFI